MSSSANHRAGKPCCLMVDFFLRWVLDYRWKSLYPDWTRYDPVSLLTFPGRMLNNLSMYTIFGLLLTFIKKICRVFVTCFCFFLKQFFTYKFLFLKFELYRFFSYKTTDMLFISMYCYIISVNTFQIRPKKTEFQKPFGLIIYSNRGHA